MSIFEWPENEKYCENVHVISELQKYHHIFNEPVLPLKLALSDLETS